MQKIKLILLINFFLLFIFSGCANKNLYVDPIDENNTARLSVDLEKLSKNENFIIDLILELDGKVIDSRLYPSLDVGVLPGKHNLSLEITAYYIYNNARRAKYNSTKEISIDFKSKNNYIVSVEIFENKLKNLNDNVKIEYTVKSKNFNLADNLVLEDSGLRSFHPSSKTPEQVSREVLDAVIQTVIIPNM